MPAFSESKRPPRAHFIGIGGTAMVAGARLALEAGWEVRGSDNPLYPPTSTMVDELNVPAATGYAAENLDWGPDVVVIGNALSRGNPEVEAVLERGLHYVSLPEWLKDAVLRARRPIVVTGTHGKTTTTALAAFLLDKAGIEAGYLIGGQPLDFPHSARLGPEGAPFVIEGDEYDTAFFDKRAKFFHYLPNTAIVTSLEFDHGDIYRDIEEIEVAFQRMLRQIPKTGHLILCADDVGALALRDYAFCNVITYGFSDEADWCIHSVNQSVNHSETGQSEFTVLHEGQSFGPIQAPLAGRHNLQNTVAALVAATLHGASMDALADALPAFKGIKRRMEVFHEANGVTFVDDFAHHPTAIEGTIAAARSRWPGRRLIVLFEPRSNTTVTNRFQDRLAESFAGAGEVWIGPIHRGETIPENERLDRGAVTGALAARGVAAHFTDDVSEIVDHLRQAIRADDVVLILSNGAFGGIYARIEEVFPKT